MRVALDTNGLYTTRAGVARYIRGLISGMRRIAWPEGWEWEMLAWPVENFEFRQPQRAWRTFYREFVWAKTIAPRRLREGRFDLWHSTANALLTPPSPIQHVVTVHDIAALRRPERFRRWHRRMSARALERARKARRVICISQFTADELVKWAGFNRSKLRVVHNGCSFHDGEITPQKPALALPDEYLLFVGSLEPGKNLRLVRSMYALAETEGVALPDLVIVGARFAGLAGEGSPPRGWHYLGHIEDSALAWLYQHARAFLFPSVYEGFGLPIAEAMCFGCPVICSPVSSLPEVAGDAALTCELEPRAYLSATRRLLGDSRLEEELAARGREQSRRFTWERCAAGVLEVYREALS
jgi:glycosyltransferase involved in cell wall biosynthesis